MVVSKKAVRLGGHKKMAMVGAAVRNGKGPWQHLVFGNSSREAKRKLAKVVGLPVRMIDPLPIGRSDIDHPTWSEVRVFEKGRRGCCGRGG